MSPIAQPGTQFDRALALSLCEACTNRKLDGGGHAAQSSAVPEGHEPYRVHGLLRQRGAISLGRHRVALAGRLHVRGLWWPQARHRWQAAAVPVSRLPQAGVGAVRYGTVRSSLNRCCH